MWIHNGSKHEICVGQTLKGPPANPACMMKPGETLDIPAVLPQLRIEFVSTPDGLRVAIYEQGIILPTSFSLN